LAKKPLTKKQDDAFDRKNGIKENSPRDKRMDKKLMGGKRG
jgi:hypothetical protein